MPVGKLFRELLSTIGRTALNRGHTHRRQLGADCVGRSLLDHLARDPRHGSREEWHGRLARGEVTLDGAVARGDESARVGGLLEWHRPPWEEPAVPLCAAALHRDDDFLAVAKPAGLPTMPSGSRFLDHTLLAVVRRRFPEASLLHRLDRGTSGIVLLARTARARRAGAELFQSGRIERRYRGRVVGEVAADEFTISAPIGEVPHPRIGRAFAATQDGRAAATHVGVLERSGATSLLWIRIATGRPHQIRIHLASVGLPLVGERFFASGGRPCADSDALPGDPGYLLHAESLEFVHPFRETTVRLRCPPPLALRRGDEADARRGSQVDAARG
jgi:23S rRNA pseudouridine1911/1915/1917 synthase